MTAAVAAELEALERDSWHALAGERRWQWFELTEVRAVEAAPDVALVTHCARSQREGEDEYRAVGRLRFASRNLR